MEFVAAFLVHLVPLLYVGFFGWSGLLSDESGWIRLHWASIQPLVCGFATWTAYKLSLLAPNYDLSTVVFGMAIFTSFMILNLYLQTPRFWARMR